MISTETLYTIAVWLVPILFAITLHEAAHGWMANKLGDPTAKVLGRISLNPIKHIDPIGTVVLPLALLMLSGFVIGWAKPVPVDMRYFKQPLLDMAVVALAGPASNFIMACGWALLGAIGQTMYSPGNELAIYIVKVGNAGITINLILMVLNLLPIPPLDGGRVVAGVLPPQLAVPFMKIEPYGMFVVIFLLVTGILGKILWPMVLFFTALIKMVFHF
ncbi:MAG: site-2 protease family protein [Gammaproteobacteria bacterium]|nr:site-2 protease family protein [Gammaproteobacteria bacterium]